MNIYRFYNCSPYPEDYWSDIVIANSLSEAIEILENAQGYKFDMDPIWDIDKVYYDIIDPNVSGYVKPTYKNLIN